MARMEDGKAPVCKSMSQSLYSQAALEALPMHHWHGWITAQFEIAVEDEDAIVAAPRLSPTTDTCNDNAGSPAHASRTEPGDPPPAGALEAFMLEAVREGDADGIGAAYQHGAACMHACSYICLYVCIHACRSCACGSSSSRLRVISWSSRCSCSAYVSVKR